MEQVKKAENRYKITVVTVCFNAVNEIEETMMSVLNQTYDDIEYIVIDGGSTDGTVDIIKRYADRLAYWVSEPDKGIYDAMNKGIKVATGDYINFMNAGDNFHTSTVVQEVVSQIRPNDDYVVGMAQYKKGGKLRIVYWPPIKEDFTLKDAFGGRCVNHQSSFIRRKVLDNGYNLSYGLIADELKFIESIMFGGGIYHNIKTIVADYDMSGESHAKSHFHDKNNIRMNFYRKLLPKKIFQDYEAFIHKNQSLYKRIIKKMLRKIQNIEIFLHA